MIRFWRALAAVALKESLRTLRDHFTLTLLLVVPLLQLILFGFAINLHPKSLPTVLVAHENDQFVNRAAKTLEELGYFKVIARTSDRQIAERWLALSRAQFIFELPPQFTDQVVREEHPQVILTADAVDPVASIAAVQAASAFYARTDSIFPVELETRLAYNPDGASQLFIIPGLVGAILTFTLVLLGALVMTRERDISETPVGLAMPRGSLLLGKAIPYLMIGCALFVILLFVCTHLLNLPWPSWSPALFVIAFIFIVANLVFGLTLSLIAKNALQAMQLCMFFYLPSMLLSGFIFPFYGMPEWAQKIGEILPLTYFLRVIRGILLKGLLDSEAWGLAWPIALFAVMAGLIALALHRWRSVRY
ncbi:MAG TPA: ABC transporter permease [Gallionella sp.]|nr:ABC transporter permease [Gallionella sp.]